MYWVQYISESRRAETAKVNTQVNVFNVYQKVEGQKLESRQSFILLRFNVYQKVEGQKPSSSVILTKLRFNVYQKVEGQELLIMSGRIKLWVQCISESRRSGTVYF